MEQNQSSQIAKNEKSTDVVDRNVRNVSTSVDSTKDYISGDSTPSSSSHQFPWIATDPKHDSKKSAKKTNS